MEIDKYIFVQGNGMKSWMECTECDEEAMVLSGHMLDGKPANLYQCGHGHHVVILTEPSPTPPGGEDA